MGNSADECRTLFKFLLSQFYHNLERIDRILKLMQKPAMHCGGLLQDLLAVVDRRLLSVNTILSIACKISDVQSVKLLIENVGLEQLDIKQAFMIAVSSCRNMGNEDTYAQSRLCIVRYLLTFINISQFNCQDVLNACMVYSDLGQTPNFTENDTYKFFVSGALQHNEFDFLEWVIENGDKLHLDYDKAMNELCSCGMFKINEVKALIEKLWQHVDDKGIFDQRKIVDKACKNYVDSEICIWFLEVFDHKLIDINKILTISYRWGYYNVVKYIVEKVDPTLFEINMNLFLEEHPFLPVPFFSEPNKDKDMVYAFLLSKSRFTVVSLQTLMNEAISRKHWKLAEALLIHCENDIRIFDMKTIVQAGCASGDVYFLGRMISNEGTKNCFSIYRYRHGHDGDIMWNG